MTVVVDASSPAGVQAASGGSNQPVTASFTPPAGSILVAAVMADGQVATQTSTLTQPTGLGAWTSIVQKSSNSDGGYVGLFWAPVTTSQAMTVAVATMSVASKRTALKVYVLTGADTSTPVATSGFAFDTPNSTNGYNVNSTTATSQTLTNGTRAGGLLIGALLDWSATATTGWTTTGITAAYQQQVSGGVSWLTGSMAATSASTGYTWSNKFGAASTGQQAGVIIQPAAGGSSFTGSASFAGSGALAASGTPSPHPTAAFSATGALAATPGTITTSGTAAFSASGALSVVMQPKPVGPGVSLSGSGSLAASGVTHFGLTGAAFFSATGTLTAAGAAARRVFVTPTTPFYYQLVPRVKRSHLFGVNPMGQIVYRLRDTGEWKTALMLSPAERDAADLVYEGGRNYTLSPAEEAVLVAAGFGANISSEAVS